MKTRGFTIVELLIVIVVIAILASISIVAYSGVQSRANDTKLRAAATLFEKAILLFNSNTGLQPWSGSQSTGPAANNVCPGSTVASGWAVPADYNCNLENLLVSAGNLPLGFSSNLPKNKAYPTTTGRQFMFYQCGPVANNRYFLIWTLENANSDDTASFDNAMTTCGVAASTQTTYSTSYKMRAGKVIEL